MAVWLYAARHVATVATMAGATATAGRYPRLHYLLASMSPLYDYADLKVPPSLRAQYGRSAAPGGARPRSRRACRRRTRRAGSIRCSATPSRASTSCSRHGPPTHVACTRGSALKERLCPLRSASARFGASGPVGVGARTHSPRRQWDRRHSRCTKEYPNRPDPNRCRRHSRAETAQWIDAAGRPCGRGQLSPHSE